METIELPEGLDDLLAVIAPAEPEDPGFSVTELAEAGNVPTTTMQGRLLRKLNAGKLIRGTATRRDTLGRKRRVFVYREESAT